MYIEAVNPINQSDNHIIMFFRYYFVLAITIKGLQITVNHLNVIDTMRFSQSVNYSREIDILKIRALTFYQCTILI